MAQSQAEPYRADPPPYGGDLQYTANPIPNSPTMKNLPDEVAGSLSEVWKANTRLVKLQITTELL